MPGLEAMLPNSKFIQVSITQYRLFLHFTGVIQGYF